MYKTKTRIKLKICPWLKEHKLYSFVKTVWHIFREIYLTFIFVIGIVIYTLPDIVRYRKITKTKAKKLIIVSHPDDETLFFSQVLRHGGTDITVLCLTNGYDPIRRNEFYKAIRYYGVNGYIMKMPDVNAFSFLFNDKTVLRIVRKIAGVYNTCELIYTHNLEGEYGHKHHRITGCTVAKVFDKSKIMVSVPYAEAKEVKNLLNKQDMDNKRYVFDEIYRSQKNDVEQCLCIWFEHEKVVRYSSFVAPKKE